jgi:hypothetical protein
LEHDFEPTSEILDITLTPSQVGDALTFTWKTLVPRTSEIKCREEGKDWRPAVGSDELKIGHEKVLPKLIPERRYSFKISGADGHGKTADVSGTFRILLAAVVPPVYGRWHYGKAGRRDGKDIVVNANDQNRWLDTLNLDPRHRAAAGLGAEVICKNQEPLMASAWEQLGDVERANDILRRAQLGREGGLKVHQRLGDLREDQFVRVTGAAHKVTLLKGAGDAEERITVAAYLRTKTPVPSAALDPGFRRVASPRRAIAKRQCRLLSSLKKCAVAADFRSDLIQRLAEGDLQAAGPVREPTGIPRLVDVTELVIKKAASSAQPVEGPAPAGGGAGTGTAAVEQGLQFDDQLISGETVKEILDPPTGKGPFDDLSGLSDIGAASSVATAALSDWLDVDGEKPGPSEPPAQGFVRGLKVELLEQLDPHATSIERVKTRFRLSGILYKRFEPGARGDPLDPIMWAPEFDQPMYEPLRDLGQSLLLPGVERIPQNTVGCLTTNRRFLESHLCGCNHEFARELLWRYYPTDHRGSYFRQFWDVSGNVAGPDVEGGLRGDWAGEIARKRGRTGHYDGIGAVPKEEKICLLAQKPDLALQAFAEIGLPEEKMKWLEADLVGVLSRLTDAEIDVAAGLVVAWDARAESLKDIGRLTEWGERPLGRNGQRGGMGEGLVLVIRGDLLRRYPNALIYAVVAMPDALGRVRPNLPEYFEDLKSIPRILPIFGAALPPDLWFFGFPFDEKTARGSDKGDDHGKFFVIEEQPGEPRFGADAPLTSPEAVQADFGNLSWSHFGFGIQGDELHYGMYLDSPPGDLNLTFTPEDPRIQWRDASSAERARCTWQKPVRVAIHASQLIP